MMDAFEPPHFLSKYRKGGYLEGKYSRVYVITHS